MPQTRQRPTPTRDRILDAAERLFAQKGYDATTLRDIAAQVAIQNPSLYKHFESKAAIYAAVLDRAVRPLLDEFWDTEQEIEKVVSHLAARPTVCKLLLRETLGGGSQLQPVVARRFAEAVEQTRSFVARSGQPKPDVRSVALRVLAIYHVVVGFSASAAFYSQLTGRNLGSKAALSHQMEIVTAVSKALFAAERDAQ